MRSWLCKRKLNGLLLATLAAGTLTVPAVPAQSDAPSTAKKPAHKTSQASSGHSTTSHSSTTHKGTTQSSAAHPSSPTSASKKSTKSASSKRKTRSKKVKGQTAPTAERINEIQEALSKKGAYASTPTGTWDGATVDAMKKFQSANGLNPTGKLDALTLQKLGLGSETAGLAAPILPPNSANRLINTASEPSN